MIFACPKGLSGGQRCRSFFAGPRGRSWVPAVGTGLILFAATAASAPGAESASEPPSRPYSVFVSHAGEADAVLDARFRNAVTALAERLSEHPEGFRLVDSADEANIRITVFDAQAVTSELKHVGSAAGFTPNRVFESRGRDFFSFEAVVRVDGHRKQMSGSGTGATEAGSFREAAADFTRRLEQFAEASYAVSR